MSYQHFGWRIAGEFLILATGLNQGVLSDNYYQLKDDIAIQVASAYLQVLLNQELRQVAINQTKLSKVSDNYYQLGLHITCLGQHVPYLLPLPQEMLSLPLT